MPTTFTDPLPSVLERSGRRDVIEFRAGQFICREGDQSGDFFIVESGMLKVTRCTPRGVDVLLGVLGPAETIGELSLMDGGARSASVQAISQTRLQSIPRELFTDLCEQHPEVRAWLLRLLARRLRGATTASADLVLLGVRQRVAQVLLDLADRFGIDQGGSVAVNHGLTQNELAQLVGSTRESTNRALASYARRGWVSLGNRALHIHDASALRSGAPARAEPELAGNRGRAGSAEGRQAHP